MKATIVVTGAWRQQPYRVDCATLGSARRQARALSKKSNVTHVAIHRADGQSEIIKEEKE